MLLIMENSLFRYALGGYDGSTMVSSTEILDPRLDLWIPGEPMNKPRGYAAAAAIKESIYVVGGLESDENMIDTVCYLLQISPRYLPHYFVFSHIYFNPLRNGRLNISSRVRDGKKRSPGPSRKDVFCLLLLCKSWKWLIIFLRVKKLV